MNSTSLETYSVVKEQIFEKLLRRMKELQNDEAADIAFCSELNPDVIVISSDQGFVFEPQNRRASELLQQRCGSAMEGVAVRERVHVHPCERQKIIDALKNAGLTVAC
jgi:hypothetical protein